MWLIVIGCVLVALGLVMLLSVAIVVLFHAILPALTDTSIGTNTFLTMTPERRADLIRTTRQQQRTGDDLL